MKDKGQRLLLIGTTLGGALISFFLLETLDSLIKPEKINPLSLIGIILGCNFIIISAYVYRNRINHKDYQEILNTINTKTEFVAFAAHQLISPITSIRWEVEALLTKKGLGKDITKVLERLKNRSERLSELVQALLNITKIEDTGKILGEPQKVNTADLIKEILHELNHFLSEKKISYKARYGSGDIFLHTDPKLLKIALTNIIENAIRYSHKKGKIEILIEEDKKRVNIHIKDEGIGISGKDLPHLYTKLFRASNAIATVPEGNGLGLYITKAIIDSMDGQIEINSEEEEGKGTVVHLMFPKGDLSGN